MTDEEVKALDAHKFPTIKNKKEKKKKKKKGKVNEKGKGKKEENKKNQDYLSCDISDKELITKQSLEIHVICAHLVNSEEYKDMEERYIVLCNLSASLISRSGETTPLDLHFRWPPVS